MNKRIALNPLHGAKEAPADKFGQLWRKLLINTAMTRAEEGVINHRFRKMGLASLLLSTANRNAAGGMWDLSNVNFDANNGKIRHVGAKLRKSITPTFEVREKPIDYTQRLRESKAQVPSITEFRLMHYHRSVALEMDKNVLRGLEEDQEALFTPAMEEHMLNFETEVASAITHLLIKEHLGGFPRINLQDYTPSHYEGFRELPLFNADGRTISHVGEMMFNNAIETAGLGSNWFKVGSQMVRHYRELNAITTPNDLGINAALNEVVDDWRYDQNLSSVVAKYHPTINHPLVVMAPGAAQIVTYAPYTGDKLIEHDDHSRTTILTPTLNIPVTLVYNLDYKGEDETSEIYYELHYDIISLKDVEWTDDPKYKGVNGIMGFGITAKDVTVNDLIQEKGVVMGLKTIDIPRPNAYENAGALMAARVNYSKLAMRQFTATQGNGIDGILINGGAIPFPNSGATGFDLAATGQPAAFKQDLEAVITAYNHSAITTWDVSGGSVQEVKIVLPRVVGKVAWSTASSTTDEVIPFVSTDLEEHVFNTSQSIMSTELTQVKYDFGTFQIAYGNAHNEVTGITGVRGTYAHLFVAHSKMVGVTQVTITIKDSNDNERSTIVDITA